MANSKNVNRTLKLYIDNKEIDGSVKSIQSRIRQLTGEMGKLTIGTKEYEEKAKKIRELNGILAAHRQSIRAAGNEYQTLSQRLGRFADGVNRYMGVVAGAIGAVTGLTMTVRKTVQQYAEMQEAEAQVRKYTGMTADEVERLNEDFKQMDTRTSREELNALAGDAGRLGITSREAIEEFVDGADKIRVALGDDLGETAVRDIGKLAQMFGEDKTKGLRGAMLSTGSAINELAQNSSAGAGAIVEFTARLAGVAQQAGMTQAEIMGIGSVMDQNMQEIPTSATVISQLITKMMQDTGRFAKLAGEDVEEFSNLLRTDANAALIKFLEAMKAKGGFADMAQMFDEMKMDGTRAVGVLSALAGHLDQLAEAQSLANEAYSEGTSVINEFNVQNSTVQADLDKAKKKFQDLSIELGQKLLPVARYGITTGSAMVKVLSTLITAVGKYKTTLLVLVSTIVALNAKQLYSITLTKLSVLWNGKLVTSFKALTAAMKANPYGLIITALTTFVGLLVDAARKQGENNEMMTAAGRASKKAAEEFENESAKINTLISMVNNSNISYEERKKKLEELKKIVPDYHADLDREHGLINNNTEALRRYLANLEKSIKMKAAQEELEEAYRKKRKLDKQKGQLSEQLVQDEFSLAAASFSASQQASRLGTQGAKTIFKGVDVATKQAQDRVSKTNNALKDVNKQLAETNKDIADLNKEIEKSSVPSYGGDTGGGGGGGGSNETFTPTPTGGGGGGHVNKVVTEEELAAEEQKKIREQVQKDLAAIDAKYQVLRNETAESYLNGEFENQEEYLEKLRNLETAELNERLNVLNLEPEKREQIKAQLLEGAVELQSELERIRKEADDKKKEEDEQKKKELEEQLKEEREKYIETAAVISNTMGKGLAEAIKGQKEGVVEAMKEILKTILLTMIDYLEKQLAVDDALILADSIAKYGPIAGSARAAVSIALAHAPYEIAKGVVQSFDTGGFTGPGEWNEAKGVVHANEFVANRHAVANPALAPVLSLIDQAQRTGSIANLTAADIAAVLPPSVTATSAPRQQVSEQQRAADAQMMSMLQMLSQTNKQLLARLKKPIIAETYATGRGGVMEAEQLLSKMKSNVSRSNK